MDFRTQHRFYTNALNYKDNHQAKHNHSHQTALAVAGLLETNPRYDRRREVLRLSKPLEGVDQHRDHDIMKHEAFYVDPYLYQVNPVKGRLGRRKLDLSVTTDLSGWENAKIERAGTTHWKDSEIYNSGMLGPEIASFFTNIPSFCMADTQRREVLAH